MPTEVAKAARTWYVRPGSTSAPDPEDAQLDRAETRASTDRGRLATLIRRGLVGRDASIGRNVAGSVQFRREIEALVRPPVNLAIRPKKRRR